MDSWTLDLKSRVPSLPTSARARAGTREGGPAHLWSQPRPGLGQRGGGCARKVLGIQGHPSSSGNLTGGSMPRERASRHKALLKLFLDGTPARAAHAAAAGHTDIIHVARSPAMLTNTWAADEILPTRR